MKKDASSNREADYLRVFGPDDNDAPEKTSAEFDEMFDEKARLREIDKEIIKLKGIQGKTAEERTRLHALEEESSKINSWINGESDTPSTQNSNLPLRLRSNVQILEDPNFTLGPITPKNQQIAIETPPGTEWQDIRIEFGSIYNVSIQIGKNRKINRKPKGLGFLNRSTKEPKEGWYLLLLMAFHQGDLPPEVSFGKKRVKYEEIKKPISRLKKYLKNIFPNVPGDPFEAYVKGKGRRLNIILSVSETLLEQSRQ